jgi:NAD(P)-dependent dehydrogenase (short-subunit alcohol dehydrogenase family)
MPAPVIIVTGVSRGIGRAIAEELQSRGAAVVGAARSVADVPATATLLAVAADVTQETGRKAIVETALARHGRIDGLVNNVGAAFRRAAVDTALEDFRQILEVNLLATFALCCAAHPHLKASRGSVVNISSGSDAQPPR